MEVHGRDARPLVPADAATDRVIAFGPYQLDRTNARLLRDESHLPLRLKTFAVLEYLALHPHRLVTRDELLDAVWTGTHVTPSVLAGCIREIRRALDDDVRAPRFVETVHGRGYRFVGGAGAFSAALGGRVRWIVTHGRLAARDSELATLAIEFAEAVAAVLARGLPGQEADRPPRRAKIAPQRRPR